MQQTSHRGRQWCFTINNPTHQPFDLNAPPQDIRYAIWSLEEGEEKTPHYQGYVSFTKPYTLAGLKKILPTAHLENAKGNCEQNISYITKNPIGGPWQIGEPPKKGKRNDWLDIKDQIKEGKSDIEIAEQYPGHVARNHGGIAKLRSLFMEPRTANPDVYVIYGRPGYGKSHWARERLPEPIYEKEPNNKWWDGWDGQTSILVDDFNGAICFTDFKRLCDKYDYKGEVKGAMARIPAKTVAYTTNTEPWKWWDFQKEKIDWEAFERRVTFWVFFKESRKPVIYEDFKEFKEAVEASKVVQTPNGVHVVTFIPNNK